ncbi:hypothetical protein J2R76_003757 [Bradyrhizobium sp. USDA 4532]|uniref:hypothetical protein n=1 Tax=unclassified Bradyrhizobium TaxID=2631580 RepID=UPI00209C9FAA|nr:MULTISPECIES: hypothetical protein [unclassified Bradyrhizobium]MCP1835420.1 hypothetical protein [Bradyrhizobium sp. USDA 4545]MCP1920166.1 hypothetical protein [Bradyrhizobium sp. USDA 4532]
MSPFANNLLFLGILAAFLIPAKKWTEMNPHRIEDGPSWGMATVSAFYTMVLFAIALISEAREYSIAAAFFGSFAFGSAIGGCFLTQFKRSPEEVPNALLRWWTSKFDGAADGLFKSIFVLPAGWLISHLTPLNGRFWSAVILAIVLVSAKTGVAMLALHDDAAALLRTTRERMLIRGSILLTMIVGIASLLFWLGLARPFVESWSHEWTSIMGFLVGIIFHSL